MASACNMDHIYLSNEHTTLTQEQLFLKQLMKKCQMKATPQNIPKKR